MVNYVWIWKLVYSYFWDELRLIVGWFWCRVFGISCGLNWEDIVVGGQGLFRVENGRVSELPRLLWHAVAWNPRRSVAGCLLWHAVAWNPRRSVAGCHFWHAVAWDSTLRRSPCTMITFQLRMRITSSSELRFGCS